jgi:hypothetical protein
LTDVGTPSSSPRGDRLRQRSSLARAEASASSGARWQKALSTGFRRSMRASTARVASTGDASPLR